jgi:hypothetical protein
MVDMEARIWNTNTCGHFGCAYVRMCKPSSVVVTCASECKSYCTCICTKALEFLTHFRALLKIISYTTEAPVPDLFAYINTGGAYHIYTPTHRTQQVLGGTHRDYVLTYDMWHVGTLA